MPRRIFHRAHYNIIAARIKEQLVECGDGNSKIELAARGSLYDLALKFTKRLKDDSDLEEGGYAFDPIRFLNACSPNPEQYLLSELWKDN